MKHVCPCLSCRQNRPLKLIRPARVARVGFTLTSRNRDADPDRCGITGYDPRAGINANGSRKRVEDQVNVTVQYPLGLIWDIHDVPGLELNIWSLARQDLVDRDHRDFWMGNRAAQNGHIGKTSFALRAGG